MKNNSKNSKVFWASFLVSLLSMILLLSGTYASLKADIASNKSNIDNLSNELVKLNQIYTKLQTVLQVIDRRLTRVETIVDVHKDMLQAIRSDIKEIKKLVEELLKKRR